MNGRAANFLALDQSAKKNGIVDAWVFRVFVPPVLLSALPGKPRIESVQSLIHWQIDCAHHTSRRVSDDAFDVGGHWLLSAATPDKPEPYAPIEMDSTQDYVAKVTCDGISPPQAIVVTGHAAAFDLGRRALGANAS